jgi:hypothetical protein
VLAALSRPRLNRCEEAMQVMQEVRTELDNKPDDYADGRDTIISIVEAGESICASLAEGTALPDLSVPTEATEVMADVTAEATEVNTNVTATPTP